MELENLTWRVEDGVGVVTFNRPKVLNAMNARTFVELGLGGTDEPTTFTDDELVKYWGSVVRSSSVDWDFVR